MYCPRTKTCAETRTLTLALSRRARGGYCLQTWPGCGRIWSAVAKRSATPLFECPNASCLPNAAGDPTAPSPLRSAGAVHDDFFSPSGLCENAAILECGGRAKQRQRFSNVRTRPGCRTPRVTRPPSPADHRVRMRGRLVRGTRTLTPALSRGAREKYWPLVEIRAMV